jgi:hypothetical protein
LRQPLRRVAREVTAVATGATPTHLHLRDRLVGTVVVTLFVDVVGTVVAFYTERHGPKTDIHSIGTAFFWVSAQLTTVSSQMTNPVTTAGRALDLVLEVYGITVVVTLAGSFGAFFHGRSAERRAAAEAKRAETQIETGSQASSD